MKSTLYKLSVVAFSAVSFAACDDFLDTMPDNRTELDTFEKIKDVLVSAYPTADATIFGDMISDNVDDMGEQNPNSDRFLDQLYHWQDVTESDNNSSESYWEKFNLSVETANTALEAIEKKGNPAEWSGLRAEALLCRAYANFMLVNYFALNYDKNDNTSLGVSIITKPETVLSPKYERATVKECYAAIQADIEEALPIVTDEYYEVPKYHFNQNAAYAFATRFYLFTEQWDKAVKCADKVLGTNPRSMLRDWQAMSKMTWAYDALTQHYISATINANLLLVTSYSYAGVYYGPYSLGKRYAHNAYIGTNESVEALSKILWNGAYNTFYLRVGQLAGTNMDSWLKFSLPYIFEIKDQVAQTGYAHTVTNAFTGDEVLLSRAEANIMLGNYDKAAEDMTIWMQNIGRPADEKKLKLTPEGIQASMSAIGYSYDTAKKDSVGLQSTIKKHLHPKFNIGEEGSIQESMLQLVLAMRRYETLGEGKRWLDIKRYGIEIPRRMMASDGKPEKITDWLGVNDPRRAIQIPQSAISAGYTPNPR